MSDPISPFSDGWLIALAVAILPIIYAVAKGVAGKWRKPLQDLEDANALLKKEAVERTDVLTEAKIRIMFLESRIEYCEAELENWRRGRWTNRGQGLE
jgi:hypothetical protein